MFLVIRHTIIVVFLVNRSNDSRNFLSTDRCTAPIVLLVTRCMVALIPYVEHIVTT